MLSQEQIFNVFFELGYGASIGMGANGIELQMTNLQLIAAAAAIHCVAKNKGEQEYNLPEVPA